MSWVLQDIATVHEWKSPHRISSSSLFSRMIHCASLSKARVVTGIAIASVPFESVNRPICTFLSSEKCGMWTYIFLCYEILLFITPFFFKPEAWLKDDIKITLWRTIVDVPLQDRLTFFCVMNPEASFLTCRDVTVVTKACHADRGCLCSIHVFHCCMP